MYLCVSLTHVVCVFTVGALNTLACGPGVGVTSEEEEEDLTLKN